MPNLVFRGKVASSSCDSRYENVCDTSMEMLVVLVNDITATSALVDWDADCGEQCRVGAEEALRIALIRKELCGDSLLVAS